MSPSTQTAEVDTPSTKTALLDAAEALFEERGIRGTSLRAITDRAGANIASVNYHFGSKTDLVRAVLARRIDPLNAERLRQLDALEERGDFDLEDVLTALIGPAVHHEDGYAGLRLLSRMHFEPNAEFSKLVHRPFLVVQQRFFAAIRKAHPELSELSLHLRMTFAIGAMAATIAGLDKIRSGDVPPARLPENAEDLQQAFTDPEVLTRQLVRFVASGLTAPEAAT